MIPDSSFTIGSTHTVCQDYALHGKNETAALIVVCDGCSGSPKTNLGASLLAESFSSCLRYRQKDPETFLTNMLPLLTGQIRNIQALLNVNSKCFDSTLLACLTDIQQEKAYFFLWGDGHLRIEHKTGEITSLDISFGKNQNAPYYPSYEIFRPNGKEAYESEFGPLSPERIWKSETLDAPTELNQPFPAFQLALQDIRKISLFSDGASSFLPGPENTAVDVDSITTQLQDFKAPGEGYLQRRVRKCQRLWKRDGIQHTDDLGIASIYFPESQ